MGVTKKQLLEFLEEGGPGWKIRVEATKISQKAWENLEARARYLANRANLGMFHIHDEPGTKGKRRVYFAVEM